MSCIESYAVKSGTTISDSHVGCVVYLSDAGEVDLATAATTEPHGIIVSVGIDSRVAVETANGAQVFVKLGATYTAGSSKNLLECALDSRCDPFSAGNNKYTVARLLGHDDYADGDLAPAVLAIGINDNAV